MIRDTLEDAYWHLTQAHLKLREAKHLECGSHAGYLVSIANDVQTDIDRLDSIAAHRAAEAIAEQNDYYNRTR